MTKYKFKYFSEIIKVSLPYMISTFFDATSFTIMVFVVSFFSSSGNELASLGSSIYIVWVLWGFSTASSSGITSLTSRFLGDQDINNIKHLFMVNIRFGFIWYIVIIIFSHYFIDLAFSFLKLQDNVIIISKEIVRYYSLIIIFSIIAAIIFSILQGIQKTKEIMYITILAVFVEVITVLIGIQKLKLSLLINLAWLNGELVRIIAGYYFLKKENIFIDLGIYKKISILDDFKRFWEALYIGFPIKIGTLIFGTVYYFIISFITKIGNQFSLAEKAVAALTLSQRFEVLIWMIDAGLTVATATIIGKTIGYQSFHINKNQKITEIKKIINETLIISTIIFIPVFIIFVFFNEQLLFLFIKDIDIVNIGKGYLFYTGLIGISMVYNSVFSGFFIAIGKTVPLTIYMIIFSLLRIPLCSIANTFDLIWLIINLTNLFMTFSLFFTFSYYIRRL